MSPDRPHPPAKTTPIDEEIVDLRAGPVDKDDALLAASPRWGRNHAEQLRAKEVAEQLRAKEVAEQLRANETAPERAKEEVSEKLRAEQDSARWGHRRRSAQHRD